MPTAPSCAAPRSAPSRSRTPAPSWICPASASSSLPPRKRSVEVAMKKIQVTSLPDAEPRPRHVAIGTFDGVHKGHQAVIEGADTVLTFDPHPLSVIHPAQAPKLITSFEVRRDLIAGIGVEELVVIPFDEAFSHVSAEDF